MQKVILSCLLLMNALTALSQTFGKEVVVVETAYGKMKIRLYEETPLHRANFLKLVKNRFYDSLLFHRVINHFMIQGGDPVSRMAKPADSLGDGDVGYNVPAEFREGVIHRKGVIAAARDGDDVNPERASSGCQFYIVMGKVRTMEDLKKYEERITKTNRKRMAAKFFKTAEGQALTARYERLNRQGLTDSAAIVNADIEKSIDVLNPPYQFSEKQIETYMSIGGTPHLDGSYTVFGEVVEGIDIIDRIAGVATGKRDRPVEDVRMKIYIQ
jgi:peptidylprolyl isomerase